MFISGHASVLYNTLVKNKIFVDKIQAVCYDEKVKCEEKKK